MGLSSNSCGEPFKSSVYLLAEEFTTFFIVNRIFTEKAILRMAEAEFITDLLHAMQDGIQEGSKAVRDKVYKTYDNTFPGRRAHERRFRETFDTISGIFGNDLAQSEFRAIRLFYPLFCAVCHMKFGIPKLRAERVSLKVSDYPRLKMSLEAITELVETGKPGMPNLSTDDNKFLDAYSVHWVHADKRIILTEYICRKIKKAVSG